MLTIILKIILCSSIFIAVYYFALEKEKCTDSIGFIYYAH
jgi:hypothetical protein